MRRGKLEVEAIPAQVELSLTRVQSCSIWLGQTGQDASDGVHPDHSRQGEVMNQVQGPLKEPRQKWQETGLKTNLHQRSKVYQGNRAG